MKLTCKCNQIYCSKCVLYYIQNYEKKFPNCNKNIKLKGIKSIKPNSLDAIKMKCINSDVCKWRGKDK